MRYNFILLLLCFFHCQSLFAQVTSTTLLQKFHQHKSLALYDQHTTAITGLSYSIPFVEEINLRTETDQFDFGRQEYAIRTIFNGFNETKYYKSEQSAIAMTIQAEKFEEENDILYARYKEVINLKYSLDKIPLFDSLSNLYNERLTQLIKTAASGEFVDAKDILRIEENLYELDQKKKSALLSVRTAKAVLAIDNDISTQFSDWISIATIEHIIASLSYQLPRSFVEKNTAAHLRNQSRYQMESSNDKRILDYAQLRYSKRDNLLFQDEFSIGLGLRLPYRGSNIKSKNDYLLKSYTADFEKNLMVEKGNEDFLQDKAAIEALIDEHEFYRNTEVSIFNTLNAQHPENISSLAYVKKMVRMSNLQKKLELEEKIVSLFINLIYGTDKLIEIPVKNYLTDTLSKL